MKIINFNDMSAKQKNILSTSQRSNIWEKEDDSFFVFKDDKMIAMYILMKNEEHESCVGLSNYVELDFSERGYIYWIETFEKKQLREILKLISLTMNVSKFTLESSDDSLPIWQHIGATLYTDLYNEFREIHTLVLDVDAL